MDQLEISDSRPPSRNIHSMLIHEEAWDRLLESLARINVNLESLRVSLQVLNECRADHEQRLRAMERWRHHLTPVLAGVTFALGAIFSFALQRWG